MKRVMLAIAVVALAAMSSVSEVRANDEVRRTPGTGGRTSDTPAGMSATAGRPVARPPMANPEHQLMMAYHQNVVVFGRALERVARQGDTVPREFARAAVAEMRRSTQELEKYRAGAMAGMPEERRAQMQKMMDEHLVTVKTHLRQLEEVAQRDTVPSRDVLTHLQPILSGAGMSPGMRHGRGMQGKGMHGCGDCGGCGDCRRGQGCQGCQGCQSMMPQHRQMMQQMTQRLKAQDAELMERVDRMKRAPKDKKIDQLADIVSLIVQQRAAVTSQMEKMQRQSMKDMKDSSYRSQGAAAATVTPAAPPVMGSADGYCDEEDAACEDADDMDDAGE